MKTTFLLGLTSLALAGGAQANLVLNGSFEQGLSSVGAFTTVNGPNVTSIANWSVESGSVDYIGSYWQAADGARSIDLAGNSQGRISQLVAGLAPGDYKLSFALSGNPDNGHLPTPKVLDLYLGSSVSPFATFTFSKINNSSVMQWETKEQPFHYAGGDLYLGFGDISGNPPYYGAALDNVSLVAVPEASTYFAGIGALAILGLSAWNRRHQQQQTQARG